MILTQKSLVSFVCEVSFLLLLISLISNENGVRVSEATPSPNDQHGQEQQRVTSDWFDLWRRLYATARYPFSVAEMGPKLAELSRMLHDNPRAYWSMDEMDKITREVDWLASQHEPKEEHCDIVSLAFLGSELARHRRRLLFAISLYLNDCRSRQIKYCTVALQQNVLAASETFATLDGGLHHDRLERLRDKTSAYIKYLVPWQGVPVRWAIRGAVDLLQEEGHSPYYDARLLAPDRQNYFYHLFYTKIQDLCAKYDRHVGPSVRRLAEFIVYNNIRSYQLQTPVKGWLTNNQICKHFAAERGLNHQLQAYEVFFWQNYWKYFFYRVVRFRNYLLEPNIDG